LAFGDAMTKMHQLVLLEHGEFRWFFGRSCFTR